MLQWSNVRLTLAATGDKQPADYTTEGWLAVLKKKGAQLFRLSPRDFTEFIIWRQAVDARDKTRVRLVFTVRFSLAPAAEKRLLAKGFPGLSAVLPEATGSKTAFSRSKTSAAGNEAAVAAKSGPQAQGGQIRRPVVVGSGPAGLFAALTLAQAGCSPLVLERGPALPERVALVEAFWQLGVFSSWGNVQFGEGGAGTFSDGKLTTGIHDHRCRIVLEALVQAGAPQEILYLAKPHIGTDQLRLVLANLRRQIEALGGEFRFGCRVAKLCCKDRRLAGLLIEKRRSGPEEVRGGAQGELQWEELPAEQVILAPGHSARDTFAMVAEAGLALAAKAFSLGLRIEHEQAWLDCCQYGAYAGHPALGPAEYKLSAHLPGGRSVYTFCMCPGGQVVAAASEAGGVVTNGMSNYRRDGSRANSALLVGVGPEDFREFAAAGPLAGMAFQRKYEALAFAAGGGAYKAPVQYAADFLAGRPTMTVSAAHSTYRPGVVPGDLASCLPEVVTLALREALPIFGRQLPGFLGEDALLTGVESRSSAPLRILRDAGCRSTLAGLYPCGEGAGYAGGIMSAAVDGIRCAQALLDNSAAIGNGKHHI